MCRVFFTTAVLFTLVSIPIQSGLQASVKLKVTNIQEVKGQIMIAVYRSQDEFNNRKGLKGYRIKTTAHEEALEITELATGWYMIAVYHDLNSNSNLDSNLLGYPLEPYGCSLNQPGMFGPSFENSRFYYDGKELKLNIRLIQ